MKKAILTFIAVMVISIFSVSSVFAEEHKTPKDDNTRAFNVFHRDDDKLYEIIIVNNKGGIFRTKVSRYFVEKYKNGFRSTATVVALKTELAELLECSISESYFPTFLNNGYVEINLENVIVKGKPLDVPRFFYNQRQ